MNQPRVRWFLVLSALSSRRSQVVIIVDNQMMQSSYYLVFLKIYIKQIVENLRPAVGETGSIFQLVTYTDKAFVLVDSVTMSSPNTQGVLAAVNDIQALAGTASNPTPALNATDTLIKAQYVNGSSEFRSTAMIFSTSEQQPPTPAVEISTGLISLGCKIFGVALGGGTVSPMLLKLSQQPASQYVTSVSEVSQVQSSVNALSASLFPDPGWSSWSSWSQCTVTCDYGTRWRIRTCNDNSTGQCVGLSNTIEACNLKNCTIATTMSPTTANSSPTSAIPNTTTTVPPTTANSSPASAKANTTTTVPPTTVPPSTAIPATTTAIPATTTTAPPTTAVPTSGNLASASLAANPVATTSQTSPTCPDVIQKVAPASCFAAQTTPRPSGPTTTVPGPSGGSGNGQSTGVPRVVEVTLEAFNEKNHSMAVFRGQQATSLLEAERYCSQPNELSCYVEMRMAWRRSLSHQVIYLHHENYTLDKTKMSWSWNVSNATFNETSEHLTILINILLSQRCVQHFHVQSGGHAAVSTLGLWHLEEFFTRQSNSSSYFSVNSTSSADRQESKCSPATESAWKLMALCATGSLGFFSLLLLSCCCPCPCIKSNIDGEDDDADAAETYELDNEAFHRRENDKLLKLMAMP